MPPVAEASVWPQRACETSRRHDDRVRIGSGLDLESFGDPLLKELAQRTNPKVLLTLGRQQGLPRRIWGACSDALDDGEERLDVRVALGWESQREVGADAVVVAAANTLALDVAGLV